MAGARSKQQRTLIPTVSTVCGGGVPLIFSPSGHGRSDASLARARFAAGGAAARDESESPSEAAGGRFVFVGTPPSDGLDASTTELRGALSGGLGWSAASSALEVPLPSTGVADVAAAPPLSLLRFIRASICSSGSSSSVSEDDMNAESAVSSIYLSIYLSISTFIIH